MGWRGAVRSMQAAARAAERDAERRRRQYAKAQMVSSASQAVAEWQALIRNLTSLHHEIVDAVDWEEALRTPRPVSPEKSATLELAAQARLEAFSPRFWDFLFGGSEKRREKLEEGVVSAREQDVADYQTATAAYAAEAAEWAEDTELARCVLSGEVKARKEVVEEMQSLSTEGLIGTEISFRFTDDFVHAVPHVHGDEVVPRVRRKQLQSGRLSESNMPAGEFNELYQDYVCSAALRVGGDMLALLPLPDVYVTCVATVLDTSTGHMEDTPILSVWFVRDTFQRLDHRHLDASDSLRNFVHRMDFKRSRGFAPVEPLQPL